MHTTPLSPVVSRRRFLGRLAAAGALALAPRPLRAASGRKLGIALAGLGGYSTGQLGPALKLTQHCRLAGVITGSAEKGRQWAAEYGFPERNIYHYDTMARLADNPDIEAVYVVTPNGLHAQHAIAAAKAGKHVICEKPMANTVADCDAIIAACKLAGVRLGMGYRLHYDPFHEELRRLVRTQEFGPFLKMDGGFAFTMGRHQWRAQKKLAGGGPLMDLGVYVIQEAFMAAGDVPAVALTARELPKQRPEFFVDVEESIEWTLEFANGARCAGYTSYNSNRNDFRAEAEGGWFEIGPAYSYRGLRAATSRGPVNVTPPASQQALQMDAFARNVFDGTPSLVPGEMGRRDMVVVEAIYASAAAGGKRVELKF
ncbi:MAG: Gfo/Idh/MocA family protein [Verrucomicrobiota bacterium]